MISSSSLKRTAKVAALTVAFTASGSAIALAGTGATTSGNNSILGGNQISVPISVPLDVCGNALALLGDAFGGCQGGSLVAGGSRGSGSATTAGNNSILGGNQISVPISVPVNACGNSGGVLGTAASGCQGGAAVVHTSGGSATTSGNNSILGGNQISVPVSVPVNACGNSLGILGLAASGCQGGSGTGTPPPHKTPPPCHHHKTPPPVRHHHHHHPVPPVRHHHHHGGGSGQSTTTTALTSSSLPTTGANFLGLLALAGSVLVGGAGCMLFAAKRGVLASAKRAMAAAR